MSGNTALTKADAAGLWHAVRAFEDCVKAMKDIEWATPELLAAEQAKLIAARKALRKVQAIRREARRSA